MSGAERPRPRARCSRWLTDARWDDGLLFPARSRRYESALRFRLDGIEVTAGSAQALVPWDVDHCSIGCISTSRSGVQNGIALVVSGDAAELTRSVHRARRNRLLRAYDGDAPLIPLYRRQSWRPLRVDDDRACVGVLLRLIADRPACRSRLASPEVVTRLLDDIRTRPHGGVHRPEGARRRTFEVMNTMRMAGFVHASGRPFPDEVVPDTDHVTDVVMRRLADNRYVTDIDFDRDDVRDLVARHHCEIEPWPFEALLL